MTKATDHARLGQIADEVEGLDALYNERALILARRLKAGDTPSELARAARIARGQVKKAITPERLEKAKSGARRRKGSVA